MSTEKLYVVIKRGLFWRPEDKGYTSEINEAGRYTKEEAQDRCHGGEQPVTMALASEFQTTESIKAENSQLRTDLAAARAEAERAKADTARLDWLDEVRADVLRPSEHDGDVEIGVDDHNECGEWNHYKRPRGTGDSIRAAIDAARADAARKEPPAKAHGCEVGE